MPLYDVLQPIKHDGKRYQSGTVTMTAKQAAPLLDAGVLRTAQDSDQSDALMPALIDAIKQLDPENPEHFSKTSKKPDVKALAKMVGVKVSAKARDAAFAEFQQQSK